MFTGLIEEVGQVKSINKGKNSAVITIAAKTVVEDTKVGDSIAVNGVCLTATTVNSSYFTADIMHESLDRSSLSNISSGDKVNLERAMSADGRFGGHIVSGHIDGVGTITKIVKDDNAIWYYIDASKDIMKYIVEKGSIAIDGISLTVAKLNADSFAVSCIPHTVANTCLAYKKEGSIVNLETDIIGRYVERMMSFSSDKEDNNKSSITKEFLLKNGF
ncbi:MAG: riboflavin synthase [Lachnospiraceae bacterium]|nr:riboflavin synthase [Lachnospiraceae bacterium]